MAVTQAKHLTLGRPSVAGLPPREAAAITAASSQSSLDAFRVGIGVAGGLVIDRRPDRRSRHPQPPTRVVHAERCAGGQLAGAPLDAAGVHAPRPA